MAQDQPIVRADDWFDHQEEYNPARQPPDGVQIAQRLHDEGLLFAINRLVLHPLGLALGVRAHRMNDEVIVRSLILFSVDDPEGIVFDPTARDRAVKKLIKAKHDVIVERLNLIAPEPNTPSLRGLRDVAEAAWGPDPQAWPAWDCAVCPEQQRNTGWSLECGRCQSPRPLPTT